MLLDYSAGKMPPAPPGHQRGGQGQGGRRAVEKLGRRSRVGAEVLLRRAAGLLSLPGSWGEPRELPQLVPCVLGAGLGRASEAFINPSRRRGSLLAQFEFCEPAVPVGFMGLESQVINPWG